MCRLPIAVLAALPWLAACVPPEYPEGRVFADGGALAMPAIAPLEPLLSTVAPDDGDTPAADLQARGDLLRTRADALRRAAP